MASTQQNDDNINFGDEGNDIMKITELNVEAQTIMVSLYNLRISIKNIENSVRRYERETIKFIRYLRKNQKGKSVKKGGDGDKKEREPSGFAKKTKIRKELVDFFKRPDVINIIDTIISEEETDSKFEAMDEDGMINRPSTTKIINRYIKNTGLQRRMCKQFFDPDEVLKKLLSPLEAADKKAGGYKCFNLQKYIKHLFL